MMCDNNGNGCLALVFRLTRRAWCLLLVLYLFFPNALRADKPAFQSSVAERFVEVGQDVRQKLPAASRTTNYTAWGLPPGLVFDSVRRTIVGSPKSAGTHIVQYLAQSKYQSELISFRMKVSRSAGSSFRIDNDARGLMAALDPNKLMSNATIELPLGGTFKTGQSISFEATSDGGSNPTWTFGPGITASGHTATYTFLTPGVKTIRFSVASDAWYNQSASTVTINVEEGVLAPPKITRFGATTPYTPVESQNVKMLDNQKITLYWTVDGAASQGISLTDSSGGVTALDRSNGSLQLSAPAAGTTYSLIASNMGGTSSSKIVVSVFPVVSVNLSSNPTGSIPTGSSISLLASVSNGSPCNIMVAPSGAGAFLAGGATWIAPNSEGTYTFTAVKSDYANYPDPDASFLRSVPVTIKVVAPPPPPPVITSHPQDVTTSVGGAATFRVVASGAGPLSYQWFHEQVPMAGSVGSSLALNGVTNADSGQYFVKVGNASGFVLSRSAVLTVSCPTISQQPISSSVYVGDSATFWVRANGSGLIYQWKKNGIPLSGQNGSTITLSSVTMSDAAAYSVSVSSSTGSCGVLESALARLDVRERAPIIGSFAVSKVLVDPSELITLSWSVSNATSLTLTKIEGGGAGVVIPIAGNSTTFSPTKNTSYVLTASNSGGTVTKAVSVCVRGVFQRTKTIVYLGAREVAEIDGEGVPTATLLDHLGSPRFLVAKSGVVSRQKYLPFGELMGQTGSVRSAKGFTNHEQTDPSGLIYMQARFYLPMYGRFASPDPGLDQHFQDTQSWNIYSYVRNNPVMMTDPTGMVAGDPDGYGMQVSQTMLGYLEGLATSLPFVGGRIAASLPQDVPEHQQVAREWIGKPVGTATQLVTGGAALKGGLTALKGGLQVTQMVTTTGEVIAVVNGGTQAAAGAAQAGVGAGLVASAMGRSGDSGGGRRGEASQSDPQRKGTPGNNQAQNKQFRDATKGLTKDEAQRLHHKISKQDYGFKEIKQMAEEVIKNRKR